MKRINNKRSEYGEKVRLGVPSVFDAVTLDDIAFQTGRAATEKARSPTAERWDVGTTRTVVDAEYSLFLISSLVTFKL